MDPLGRVFWFLVRGVILGGNTEERRIALQEQMAHLAHEAAAVLSQVQIPVVPDDTYDIDWSTSTHAHARNRFATAAHRVLSCAVGLLASSNQPDSAKFKHVLAGAQRLNRHMVSSVQQRRRASRGPAPRELLQSRVNLGDVHPSFPASAFLLELTAHECSVRMSPLLCEKWGAGTNHAEHEVGGVFLPLVTITTRDSFETYTPTNFCGMLATPADVLLRPNGPHTSLLDYISLCQISLPRWLPSTLRYAPLLGHELMHVPLRLIETLLTEPDEKLSKIRTVCRSTLPEWLIELSDLQAQCIGALVEAFDPTPTQLKASMHRGFMKHSAEFIADIGALVMFGPAFGLSLVHYLELSEPYEEFYPYDAPHPSGIARLALMRRYAILLGFASMEIACTNGIAALREERRDSTSELVSRGSNSNEKLIGRAVAWEEYTEKIVDYTDDLGPGGELPFDEVLTLLSKTFSRTGFPQYIDNDAIHSRAPNSEFGKSLERSFAELSREIIAMNGVVKCESISSIYNAMWICENDHISEKRDPAGRVRGRARGAFRICADLTAKNFRFGGHR